MGNDTSQLKGLLIEKTAIETNEFWSLFNAELPRDDNGSTQLSIFRGEAVVGGQLWVIQTPLEKSINNLKIYRHPYILKYICSWEKYSQKFLATEQVRPLSTVLSTQNSIEICLGLRNILCSLIFLTETAKARHLNIALSSIYVNAADEWRLGGFQYVWKENELNKDLLDLSSAYRSTAAICRQEIKTAGLALEQYAFGVLCQEVLKNCQTSDIPYVLQFREYCANHLKHPNGAMRPKLSAVLLHEYFNHDFILIYSFLTELPLKNQQEKQDFFTGLVDRLRNFDDYTIASQIGSLLLSRMVLLDAIAQLCVLPFVFRIKTDIFPGVFTQQTFTKVMIPKIMQIFCVRDAQIRVILLEYFVDYVQLMNKEDLQMNILPNLLQGIKDTNDTLVAKTLRCLADLVPILGSTIVVGSNRARLFADGRPHALPDSSSQWSEPRSITPVMSPGQFMTSVSPLPDNVDLSGSCNSINSLDNFNMTRRLSPVGGEAEIDAALTDCGDCEEEAWSDWENGESRHSEIQEDKNSTDLVGDLSTNSDDNTIPISSQSQTAKSPPASTLDDINQLDIIVTKTPSAAQQEEIDFFKDMEPVIQSTRQLNLSGDDSHIDTTATSGSITDFLEHDQSYLFNDLQPAIQYTIQALLSSNNSPESSAIATPTSGNKSKDLFENISVDNSRFEINASEPLSEEGWNDGIDEWEED